MADVNESPSTPAQARTLATVELLELILLSLDPITLFAIQRVCKQWKGLVADSHRLQEHMFLRAAARNNKRPKPELQPTTLCPTTTILTNDTARNHYYCKHGTNDQSDADGIELSSISLSPVLTFATQYIHTPNPSELAVTCGQTTLLLGSSQHQPSWHNMYLSSPACKSATVALWWTLGDCMRGSVYLESLAGQSSVDEGGLRFKDVVEAALAMRAGKWRRLPGGKVLPLSAVGRDVSLGEFLEEMVREDGVDGEEVEATSLIVLSF